MTDELIIAPRPNQRAAVPLPEGMTHDEAIEHAAALLTAQADSGPPPTKGTTIDRQGYRYLRAESS